MREIFVLEVGAYSYRHVVGVYSSLEQAQEAAATREADASREPFKGWEFDDGCRPAVPALQRTGEYDQTREPHAPPSWESIDGSNRIHDGYTIELHKLDEPALEL